MERIDSGSRVPNGRWIGVVYLLYFLTAAIGGLLTNRVVVHDPVATVANLMAHEPTYRAGFALTLIGNIVYVVLTVLFYRLFRSVHRTVALLMLIFSLIGGITQIVAGLFQLVPLLLLHDHALAGVFTVEQIRAAATVSLRTYSQAYSISFVLFGLFDLHLGYLIFRSTYVPRILGVLMMIAGVVAMVFLYPPLAMAIRAFVLPGAGTPEVLLMLWLIIKGVKTTPSAA